MRFFRATSNLLLSLIAAASSIVLVLLEGHVQISLTGPSTWPGVFDHKCGCVMMACIGWAVAETARALFFAPRQAEFHFQIRDSFAGRILQ